MKTRSLLLTLAAALTLVLGMGCDKGDNPTLHDTYYYFEGAKIPLTAMKTKYYMVFKTADKQAVIEALNEKGIATPPIIEEYPLGEAWGVAELSGCSRAIVVSGKTLSYEMIPELVYLAPYYKTESGSEMGITNIISARPEGSDGLDKLESLADQYRFFILGKNQFDQSIYYMACIKQTKGNALEIANLIYEKYGFYATPEFMGIISELTFKTDLL